MTLFFFMFCNFFKKVKFITVICKFYGDEKNQLISPLFNTSFTSSTAWKTNDSLAVEAENFSHFQRQN